VSDANRVNQISSRKLEHLELALEGNVESTNGLDWNEVRLVHNSLPEIDLGEVDLSTDFLGHRLSVPIWITGMTGGHQRAALINARLAAAAERHGLAMGLGSQRAGLADAGLMATYRAARDAAPHAVLVANIGAPQLVSQGGAAPLGMEDIVTIVESIQAQALAIHLNFLQEVVQPEGDRNARGVLDAIRWVVQSIAVPVLVKETGAGIAREQVKKLQSVGVAAIDVGGAGGTSMVKIEGARGDQMVNGGLSVAEAFGAWGIPTTASILEARDCGLPIVATGGVRTGVDAARAIALGASAVGVGLPFLVAADAGEGELNTAIERFTAELRSALFLTGSRTPGHLQRRGAVILGNLASWKTQRGL
jgi:isopentenyl-diphosphate delta-isomerase